MSTIGGIGFVNKGHSANCLPMLLLEITFLTGILDAHVHHWSRYVIMDLYTKWSKHYTKSSAEGTYAPNVKSKFS